MCSNSMKKAYAHSDVAFVYSFVLFLLHHVQMSAVKFNFGFISNLSKMQIRSVSLFFFFSKHPYDCVETHTYSHIHNDQWQSTDNWARAHSTNKTTLDP